MTKSLGVLLAVCLAGLQFVAVTLVVWSSYVTSESALLDHARDLLSDVATNTSEHAKGFLAPAQGAAVLATRLAENEIVSAENGEQLEKLLFQQLQTAPQFAGVFYGDEQGNFVYVSRSDGPAAFRTKIVSRDGEARETDLIWRDDKFASIEATKDPQDTYDPRSRPWYSDAREQLGSIWTDPYIFFSSQKPGITVASPVIDPSGRLKGVIGVDIEIDAISGFLSGLEIGGRGSALILNENGDVIAHPNPEIFKTQDEDGSLRFANIREIDDPIARAAFGDVWSGDAEQGISLQEEVSYEFLFEDEVYVSTAMPILTSEIPWTVAVYAPEGDFIQAIRDNRTQNIWLAGVVALITGLIGLLLANFISKPVRAFAVRSALISQGELDPSEPLPRTYTELEKANDALMDQIARRRKSEQEYGMTFDLASRGMAQIDPKTGQFTRVNTTFAEMMGYDVEEMLSMSFDDLAPSDPKGLTPDLLPSSSGVNTVNYEKRCLRKDGEAVWVSINIIMIRDDTGQPVHGVATIDDITQTMLAQTKISELNRDLSHFSRLNVMGQMASGLAHELNQPLTAITQNIDAALSIEKDKPQNDPEQIEILNAVGAQAYRAGDIIRALRGFVRKDEGAKQGFDLVELLETAQRLVQAEANEAGAKVLIATRTLPDVFGVRVQVAQVAVNLLRNAIEAVHGIDAKSKIVQISTEVSDGFVMVSVDDSGPGVSPEVNLFTQFDTTKGEGMGLGLSISRSLAEANGGRLWHDSSHASMTRFCFTVPLKKEAISQHVLEKLAGE